jgi:putative ABC transport system ATP-binding protein
MIVMPPGLAANHTSDTSRVVVVDNATKRYVSPSETVHAVREASFTLDAGEFVILLGASGSGKSTLLGLMAGLDIPDTGTVGVLGTDVTTLSPDERARLRLAHVGLVFQDHNLIEEFTALENVMLPLEALGWASAAARDTARQTLGQVGMDGLADRLPAQLSGGQRQRVGIARGLVGERRLLLADEPTGSLDSDNARTLFQLLSTMCRAGAAVVAATHDPVAVSFADRVLEMTDGRLRERSGPR